MARRERIFVSGGKYHIHCRVARGERVFQEAVEAENWIQVVSRVAGIHELTVPAWCLMSNHYHLVVRIGPPTIVPRFSECVAPRRFRGKRHAVVVGAGPSQG